MSFMMVDPPFWYSHHTADQPETSIRSLYIATLHKQCSALHTLATSTIF